MTDRELFMKVLDALEWNLPVIQDFGDKEQLNIQHNAITILRDRLAQPEQEPVAWANSNDLQNFDMRVRTNGGPLHTVPLYTTPPQRKPLNETTVFFLADKYLYEGGKNYGILEFARAIESRHGIES